VEIVVFSRVLREERINKGFTQQSLAQMVGVSQQTVSALERGMRNCPPDLVVAFAKVLASSRLLYAYCNECPATCRKGVA